MEHLTENAVAALMAGALVPEERTEIDRHLDGCADCRELMAAAAQLSVTSHAASELSEISAIANAPWAKPELSARYTALGLLGFGGMGEVYAVRDAELDRVVALKRIRPGKHAQVLRERFLEEAKRTAQLEHPNIVPIHDVGFAADGSPYFIMKRVEGRTLRAVLDGLASGDPALTAEYGPTRLGIVFLQMVQAVAHAHARGVLHCDLKPTNVLIGRHGEVLVTDWGLARVLGADTQAHGGTPRYMSPEQAAGGTLDVRSDVYALGAVLYELLTLHKASEVAPRARAPGRDISPEVEQIALKALEREPARRFDTADALAEAVEAWLSGSRRRKNAEERHAEAERHYARHLDRLAEARVLERTRAGAAAAVKPYDAAEKKQALWQLEDQLEAATLSADEALGEALDCWSQAVGIDPAYQAPAVRLADVHAMLFVQAEQAHDRRAALQHRRQVERHHRGRHEALLRGRGRVQLDAPPGASVRCVQLVEQGKRVVEGAPVTGGFDALPIGSYLFTVSAAGTHDARVHVLVARGSDVRVKVRLFPGVEGFVHVPAGPFVYGGDRAALNSAPRQVLELPDFFIAKFAVTCAEYLEFLNDVRVPAHVPRNRPDGGYLWPAAADGVYRLPEHDADGNPCHPRAAVMGVSFHDAEAYAAWRGKRDGRPYRLPTEEEWEKAARGADGRIFPWGNGFDPIFCKMALSRPGRPQPEPVGAFEADCSVYGMRDAAGTIREWTSSFFDEANQTRVLRGGAWYFNPHYCRLAFRHGYLPHIVFSNFGIRLCFSPS